MAAPLVYGIHHGYDYVYSDPPPWWVMPAVFIVTLLVIWGLCKYTDRH